MGSTILVLPNDDFSILLYGVVTFGTPKAHFSVNLGYGYAEDTFPDIPFISVSGQVRVGKNFAFVTENFLIPTDGDDFGLVTYGMRFLLEGASIDFGFATNGEVGDFFPLGFPFATIVVPFGKR